jgi:hypothetical protein
VVSMTLPTAVVLRGCLFLLFSKIAGSVLTGVADPSETPISKVGGLLSHPSRQRLRDEWGTRPPVQWASSSSSVQDFLYHWGPWKGFASARPGQGTSYKSGGPSVGWMAISTVARRRKSSLSPRSYRRRRNRPVPDAYGWHPYVAR